MLLSELLGREVRCAGETVGRVVDARFIVRGRVEGALAQAQLLGLLVGPERGAAFLGYERDSLSRPALLRWILTRRQDETFLVDWTDVQTSGDVVELRPGFGRWSARLESDA